MHHITARSGVTWLITCAVPAIAVAACIQTTASTEGTMAPRFDVASVKWLQPPLRSRVVTSGGPGTNDPTRFVRSNVGLRGVISTAFGVPGAMIQGPDWLDEERYEIVANVPPNATREQLASMLVSLLGERFGLVYHREQRLTDAYEIVPGKKGFLLQPNKPQQRMEDKNGFPALSGTLPTGGIQLYFNSTGVGRLATGPITLEKLAIFLTSQLSAPVVNSTKISGEYTFVFFFSKQQVRDERDHPDELVAPEPRGYPDLLTAVREQLGLEVRAAKIPLTHVVIDRIQKIPTAN